MNNQGRNIIGRRGIILSLAVAGVAAGLLWFGVLGGVGAASADGGPNSDTQRNSMLQDQHQQPPVNSCIIFFIPC